MNQEDREKIRKINKELKGIHESLAWACESESLEILDLVYIAQRINDLKQARRIIEARNI